MFDNFLLIAFGVLLIVLSITVKHVRYGIGKMNRPQYPITRAQQTAVLVIGVTSILLGIWYSVRAA